MRNNATHQYHMQQCHAGETGLSEVVGFVLLLGIIIAAFSLYLTYSVPLQGRDNEIRHMDEVKDAFIGYKIGVDSLWRNDQPDSVLSTTVKMGTGGVTVQGTSGFLPIMQPVASGGTVAINQRTASPEVLQITSYSYIGNQTYRTTIGPETIPPPSNPLSYHNPPDALNITFTDISNIGETADPLRAVIVHGTDTQGVAWEAMINLTPRKTYYENYTSVTDTVIFIGTVVRSVTMHPMEKYYGTDITITVLKNDTRTLADFSLYSNITDGRPYIVNLMDPTYGLQSNIRATPSISFTEYDPGDEITAVTSAEYSYTYEPEYEYSVPLGAVEYRANNYYWIPQTYYYQLGGVFLSQNDGIVPKLSPSISFVYNKTIPGPIRVNIDAIAFDQEKTGVLGGSTAVRIGTKVKPDSGSLPYADLAENTMNVSIRVSSPGGDTAALQMWRQYFEEAANRTGGIPGDQGLYTVGTTPTEAYITIRGAYDPTIPGTAAETPDILLKVRAVNLTASIQGTGNL